MMEGWNTLPMDNFRHHATSIPSTCLLIDRPAASSLLIWLPFQNITTLPLYFQKYIQTSWYKVMNGPFVTLK